VELVVEDVQKRSRAITRLVGESRVAVAGAMYDVATGAVEFLEKSEQQ
jgi:hypothetical protein